MPKDFSKVNRNPSYTSRRATALAEEPAAPITEKEPPQPMDSAQEEAPVKRKRPPAEYSRHLQSLIKPATHAALVKIADAENVSVNAIVNAALEEYIRQH